MLQIQHKLTQTLCSHMQHTTQDGQRGHLEGLASVYCELLMAPFGDVITALESARQAAWAEQGSPQNRSTGGGSSSNGSGSGNASGGGRITGLSGADGTAAAAAAASAAAANFSGGVCVNRGHRGSLQHGGLPNSHSQPIYVPGKYSVCVSVCCVCCARVVVASVFRGSFVCGARGTC